MGELISQCTPMETLTVSGCSAIGCTVKIRLVGDWALLGSEETKAAVSTFASDQDAFFDAFAGAWAKVISKGQHELQACASSGEEPTNNDYVQNVYAALTCQDSPSCKAEDVCTRSKIRARCPRTCGMCPDQL